MTGGRTDLQRFPAPVTVGAPDGDVAPVAVRELLVDELGECAPMYADVMGLGDGDGGINARLLAAMQRHGGVVTGAFVAGRMVGFAYGFPGLDGRAVHPFLYSQLAVVDHGWQGRGVGRLLKQGQRRRALELGYTRMRWAFDPWLTRNGHFNLSVLGARVIESVPQMYGTAGIRQHESASGSDRFVVEWALDREPRAAEAVPVDALPPGACLDLGHAVVVALPAEWGAFRAAVTDSEAARVHRSAGAAFDLALSRGLVGVRCDLAGAGTARYLFTADPDAPGEPRPAESTSEERA